MESGIYQILNIKTKKFYVGSAENLHKRFLEHKNDLRSNRHPNIHLQRSWNKYGEKIFEFNILENVNPEQLIPIWSKKYKCKIIVPEQKYIDKYWNKRILFNLCKFAGSSKGRKHSLKTKEQIRQNKLSKDNPQRKTYNIKFPDGHIEKIHGIREFCRNNNLRLTNLLQRTHLKGYSIVNENGEAKIPAKDRRVWLGRHHTEETKNKLSLIKTGQKRSVEAIEKQRQKMFGNQYAKNNGKLWNIKFPSGEIKIIKNLNRFCRDKNLTVSNFLQNKKSKKYILLGRSAR